MSISGQGLPEQKPPERSAGAVPATRHSRQPASGRLDNMELGEFANMLRRHSRLILGVTIAALVVAGIALYFERPVYQSSAAVRLADARHAMAGGFEQEELDGETDSFLSELEILRSRTLAGRVVDAEGLRIRPLSDDFDRNLLRNAQVDPDAVADTLRLTFSATHAALRADGGSASVAYGAPLETDGVRFAVAAPPGVGEAALEIIGRERAIDLLLENLIASSREPTNVIDVHYTAGDPLTAQRVLNQLITSFQDANAERAQKQSKRRREFLEVQIARNDSILVGAQLGLSAFRSREGIYSAQDKLQAQQASSTDLQIRQRALASDARMYRSLLNGLQNSRPGEGGDGLRTLLGASAIGSNPVLGQLSEQLSLYQTEREALTTGRWARSPNHPDVIRLKALIASTEERLTRAVRSHLATLDAQVAALRDQGARASGENETLPQTEAEEVRFVQQVETVREMGDRLREEYQRAQIAEAVEVGQVEIVDNATLPHEPANLGRAIKLGLALLLGLLLGGGAALLMEIMNPAVRQYREIAASFDLPQLAVIPRIEQRPNGQKRLPSSFADAAGMLRPNGNANRAGARVTNTRTLPWPDSPAEEAFRTLRTNLMFSSQARDIHTLVVTSAFPQEGKSITASSLASAFAHQGVRTLLVDADLRRPKLHLIFDTAQSPGLSCVLNGGATVGEAIRPTKVTNLYLIPSGVSSGRPTELLGGSRMRDLLREVPEQIDLMIVDTPPLLAAAEASILAAEADAVVLVIRAGRTARGAVQQAVEQLATVGARVVGAVLNDPETEVSRYGDYYSAYGYYDPLRSGADEPLARRE